LMFMKESDDVKQKSDSQMFGVDPTIWWDNQHEKTCPIIHKGELAKTDMPACISIQDLHAHPSEGNDLQLRRFKSHQTRLLLLLLLTPPRPAAQEVLVTPKKTIPLPHAGAFDYRTFSQIWSFTIQSGINNHD
jgi:hypothetical protein